MAIPGRTLTLYGAGRAPGCFGTVSSTDILRIAEGATMIMPHATSGFSCYTLSCIGNRGVSSGAGFIGVPPGAGEQSGAIKQVATAGCQNLVIGLAPFERTTGSTVVVEGGGKTV